MNLEAKKGDKVVFLNENGHDWQPKEAREKHGLVEGNVYTVAKMEVHNFSSDVWLEEVPGIAFNTVMFEDEGGDVEDEPEVEVPKGPVKKVWLTEWSRGRRGDGKNQVSSACITMNNIELALSFSQEIRNNGIQVRTASMDIEELGLLRDALNKFWAEKGLE